jgi:hypothetical protein
LFLLLLLLLFIFFIFYVFIVYYSFIFSAASSQISALTPRRRILYETSGESCSPGIITSDWNAVFEEQLVVPRMKDINGLKSSSSLPLSRNVFILETKTLLFAPVVARTSSEDHVC